MLGAAVGLQIVVAWRSEREGQTDTGGRQSLAQELPSTVPGASIRDEPVAETAEMKRKVGELLNYDDAVFRIYTWPDLRVSVYVAWWGKGRMSPRLVAAHTPDVCWPGNGWIRDSAAEKIGSDSKEPEMGPELVGGQRRVFTLRGVPEYLIYWHRVGSEFVSYGTGREPPWWAFFGELWHYGFKVKQSQLFVRVSSDQPMESVWQDSRFAPVRIALEALVQTRKN